MADFGFNQTGMATPIRRSRLFDRHRVIFRGIVEDVRGKAAPCGRNELCPCGSGKKYKKCCLPKG